MKIKKEAKIWLAFPLNFVIRVCLLSVTIKMIALSLLNTLFVNCHNLSITLKCFALFSLHCTVLTITKVTLCVRITCTSPVLTSLYFHQLQPVSLLLSNSRLSVVIRKREQQREEYPALPCGLIPEVVFNKIIEIINLFISVLFTLRIL